MDKQAIILLGPPGSGKGTQGTLLAEKLGLYYFETSKILENSFKENKPEDFIEMEAQRYFFGEEEKKWKEGILNSPPFVRVLIEKEIKMLCEKGESLLLSGSPRTLYEAETLMPFLEDLYGKENIKVIFMQISAKETIFRNSHRRICQLMRHPILYSKETEPLKYCPIDGSKLIKREGLDAPETIKVRLKQFAERTMPIIDYLKKHSYQVKEIDGAGSVVEVFERNLKALK